MRKHFVIDVEMVLTPLTDESKEAIFRLAKTNDVVFLSNYDYKHLKDLLPFLPGRFFVLSQSGNFASKGWKTLWKKRMNRVHKAVASEHIRVLKSIADEPPVDPKTIVKDLGGIILYSVPGHGAPDEERESFDPGYKKRGKMLDLYPLNSSLVRARVSGNDSIVYTGTGMDVEDNIKMLQEREGWVEQDCIYIISRDQLLIESNNV